jgi:hypothetical protein
MNSCKNITDDGMLWGGLYEPFKQKTNPGNGLRVAIFGSTNAGVLVIDSLSRFEQKHPGLINLVGVATDDPVDPNTRISVQKRIWRLYHPDEISILRDRVIDASIHAGIPCYTGGVKTEYFRKLFTGWNPDIIIMCCFGQKIDDFIINHPQFGMYNFHPSDLAAKIGAGPRPFSSTMENGHKTSTMTVHLVTEMIDHGPIVGNSPAVNICTACGDYPASILTLQEKIPSVSGWLSIELVLEVIKIRESGKNGAVPSIDFNSRIPDFVRQELLKPATDDLTESYKLPLHDTIK